MQAVWDVNYFRKMSPMTGAFGPYYYWWSYVEIMNLCTCCVWVKSVSSVIHCYSSMFLQLSTFKVNCTITVHVASIQRIQTLLYDSGSHSGCFLRVAKCGTGRKRCSLHPAVYLPVAVESWSLGGRRPPFYHRHWQKNGVLHCTSVGSYVLVSTHFGGGSGLQLHVSC